MEFMLVGIEFGLSLIILIIQGILFSLPHGKVGNLIHKNLAQN